MYDQRLAEIYDLLYAAGKDYAAESADLTALIRSRHATASDVLDVACGTGEHLRHLREHFPHVEGLELSAPMRAVAAAKVPGVTVHPGDMRDFDLGRTFDAVLCLFSAIGYVRDEEELRATAARLAAHLRPGGVLVVEPWLFPDQWRDGHISHTIAQREGMTAIRLARSRRDGRRSIMDMHYLVADRDGIRHFTDVHELTLLTAEEYGAALAGAGLANIEFIEGWTDGRGRIIAIRP